MNETIIKLDKSGDLLKLFKGGYISWTVMRDKDIYLTFTTHLHTGKNKTQSIKDTADQFDMSDRMIWKIVKKMQ